MMSRDLLLVLRDRFLVIQVAELQILIANWIARAIRSRQTFLVFQNFELEVLESAITRVQLFVEMSVVCFRFKRVTHSLNLL